jgi:uncharacterized repeat protein (TIGR04076 family)
MNRRNFIGKAGCGAAGLMASGTLFGALQDSPPPLRRKKYKIEIEIYEAKEDSGCHKKGEKYAYPQDWGKICPWFRAAMIEPIRLMEWGVTLPWKYTGTPYEKVIDPDSVTTEFIRCPDPTADLVGKIIRTRIG